MSYMLDMMYSMEALHHQVASGVEFYLFNHEGEDVGYSGIQHDSSKTKIHKLYLVPEYQGKGLGRYMLDFVLNRAQSVQSDVVTLNVNRFNQAVAFYEHYGFEIVLSEDIDIGNGYLMEDYRMEYPVLNV